MRNYTSASTWSSTWGVEKPDRSSLSSAKLAFGSVMSQLLDSSSAGNPPPPTDHPPATCQLPYHCSDVRRGCAPWEHHGNPASFSLFAACHLNIDTPPPLRSITSCFSHSLFPLYFWRWADACLPAARSHRIVSPQHLPPQFEVSLPVCSGWSHMQHHPHFETTPSDAHQSCRKSGAPSLV